MSYPCAVTETAILFSRPFVIVFRGLFVVVFRGLFDIVFRDLFVIVFRGLFVLLFCGALSYGFYFAAAMILSHGVPTKSRMEIIEDFVMKANSLFMNLLEEAPWYGWLIYIFIACFVIPALLVATSVVIYFVYKGFKNFLFEAWKYITVDVDPPL